MSSNPLRTNRIHRCAPPAKMPWVPTAPPQKSRIMAFFVPDRVRHQGLALGRIPTVARDAVHSGKPRRHVLGGPVLHCTIPRRLGVPVDGSGIDDAAHPAVGRQDRSLVTGWAMANRPRAGFRRLKGLVDTGTDPVQRIETSKCLNHPRIVTILNPVKKVSSPASPWNS